MVGHLCIKDVSIIILNAYTHPHRALFTGADISWPFIRGLREKGDRRGSVTVEEKYTGIYEKKLGE